MIQFTKSFKTTDGKVFGSIEEAQTHELIQVFSPICGQYKSADDVAKMILDKKEFILDVLTTTPNSKPKARAINGGRKSRKTVITDAPTSVA
jgi:hypothetical protein